MESESQELSPAGAAAVARLGQQLGHPLRVRLLAHVAWHGPCSFSELVAVTGGSQAQVSNHLAGLRDAGLVATRREGRQSLYRVPNADVAEVLANLASAAGVPLQPTPVVHAAASDARRCYDHLGGALGVAVLDALVERGGLAPARSGDELVPGPDAAAVLPEFGVARLDDLQSERRRTAYGCPDWTERRPHLGGALGAAVTRAAFARRWVADRPGSRAVRLTAAGRRALAERGVRV
jgi:DNA-binding transcriptional ArsR family regulator